MKARKDLLHSLEIPTAQLTALTANMNRDAKKQRKAFDVFDFCFFHDQEANKPQARAAAAYMRLVIEKMMPPWALFCFTDFKHAEASPRDAEQVAIIGDGFVLLAPDPITGGFQGLLLAEHRVAGMEVEGAYMGETVKVRLPLFEDFVLAKEGVELDQVGAVPIPGDQPVFAGLSG